MADANSISLKNDEILKTKKKLNLALNILISLLGISSLLIKFFIVDGVLAFRAFTVDGNLFTTIVSVIAVCVNIRELLQEKESESRRMFFLQLASAVTEAVIFIVVMVGYLPIFPDNPKITPYHMFCLHVAIPILAVLRFIFFEKPLGILKPSKLLVGAIPIGVYGIGVVSAIKLGILPISLVPYSFLDFKSNFLWYFVFALVVIPSFGFLWSWLFYRLNIRTSLLWYSEEDVERLNKARVKALSSYDTVNSSILLIYCALAVVVLMFSLMGTSRTSTKIQHEMMQYVSYYMLDDYSNLLGTGEWQIRDGALYKGNLFFGDGTEENANKVLLPESITIFETNFYVKADKLSPEIAVKYNPDDYVSVMHSSGAKGPVTTCGDVLDRNIVSNIYANEDQSYYEVVKDGKTKYYHFCMTFGATMYDSGVGIVDVLVPSSELTVQAKNAEYNNDIMMIVVIITIFAVLYMLTYSWIKTLEKSVDFLRAIASGRTPEEPISLGDSIIMSGLERDLNVLREINMD